MLVKLLKWFNFLQVKFDENKAKLALPTIASKSAMNGNPLLHSRYEPSNINIATMPYNGNGSAAHYNNFHRTH
jgi:hypothetical protein